ncbi:unnamed protein product [Caretta caretta]
MSVIYTEWKTYSNVMIRDKFDSEMTDAQYLVTESRYTIDSSSASYSYTSLLTCVNPYMQKPSLRAAGEVLLNGEMELDGKRHPDLALVSSLPVCERCTSPPSKTATQRAFK